MGAAWARHAMCESALTEVLNLKQDMEIIGRSVGWHYLITDVEVSNEGPEPAAVDRGFL